MPKLSIIIPVYNAEKYITKCLDSILSQSFKDYELILVNDGSKDNSGTICEQYKLNDSRIFVYHQLNCGVSKARNRGLEAARGEFITFIDADDELMPGYLSSFSYENDVDFELQGFILNFKNNPSSNRSFQPLTTHKGTIKEVFEEAEIKRLSRGPSCKLFRNEIISMFHIKFPENLSFGEDAIFVKEYISKCNKCGRTIATLKYLYNDYDNPESLTKRRHDYLKFYEYTWTDFKMYKGLEEKFGSFSHKLNSFFIRERSLEMYWCIILCMTQDGVGYMQKVEFLRNLKSEMFLAIQNRTELPTTYRFLRLCLKYLSLRNATSILNLVINNFIKI